MSTPNYWQEERDVNPEVSTYTSYVKVLIDNARVMKKQEDRRLPDWFRLPSPSEEELVFYRVLRNVRFVPDRVKVRAIILLFAHVLEHSMSDDEIESMISLLMEHA